MRSPFSGMDPYLEHPSLWPDVHNSLIGGLAAGRAERRGRQPQITPITQIRSINLCNRRNLWFHSPHENRKREDAGRRAVRRRRLGTDRRTHARPATDLAAEHRRPG
ncbi:MAG: DUF4058 family protein [Candidatus Promineofilum sp.]|nr:DUF4058 family protein [Promineifilum sp.]